MMQSGQVSTANQKDGSAETKYMCAELVRIRTWSQSDEFTEEIANLEEISASSACLQLDHPLRRGAHVEMQSRTCLLRGRVQTCKFVGIGYDVNVQFNEPNAWNRELFEPEHFLDIDALLRPAEQKAPAPKVRTAGSGGFDEF